MQSIKEKSILLGLIIEERVEGNHRAKPNLEFIQQIVNHQR